MQLKCKLKHVWLYLCCCDNNVDRKQHTGRKGLTYSSWYQHVTEAGAGDPGHTSTLRSAERNKGTQAVCCFRSAGLHLSYTFQCPAHEKVLLTLRWVIPSQLTTKTTSRRYAPRLTLANPTEVTLPLRFPSQMDYWL